jgi:drug/metabolite transporter (DMT)-like permease
MDEFNPYAPPKDEVVLEPFHPQGSGVWRDGPLLVMTKDAQLPDRCLKCNLPAGGWRLKRKLSWHEPAWYFLVLLGLIGIIIYVIAASVVRQTATVMVPLCEEHRRRRKRAIAAGWLLGLAGIAAFVLGGSIEEYQAAAFLGGMLLLVTGLIFGMVGSQVAVPKRIDERFVWLKKVHPATLEELPVYTY